MQWWAPWRIIIVIVQNSIMADLDMSQFVFEGFLDYRRMGQSVICLERFLCIVESVGNAESLASLHEIAVEGESHHRCPRDTFWHTHRGLAEESTHAELLPGELRRT